MKQVDPNGSGSTKATREKIRNSFIAPEKQDKHKGHKTVGGKDAKED